MFTMDYVPWPQGYGCGSSGIRSWIEYWIKEDKINGVPKSCSLTKKAFPKHWGSPPRMPTSDAVDWPQGYGCGSSNVRSWIEKKIREDKDPCSKPSVKNFPKHWGQPPMIQTKDRRVWPDGYGCGSGTVARWIKENISKDN